MTGIIGGRWVVVPLERKGGPKSGEPITEPMTHDEAWDRLHELQKDHDHILGLALVVDGEVIDK